MASKEKYYDQKPAVFENLRVYVGSLKKELERCLQYYLYVCYGKRWRNAEEIHSFEYLIRSITLGVDNHDWFIEDIKRVKHLYKIALNEIISVVSQSNPMKTDDVAFTLIRSFIYDVDQAIKAVKKSQELSQNSHFEMDILINEIKKGRKK